MTSLEDPVEPLIPNLVLAPDESGQDDEITEEEDGDVGEDIVLPTCWGRGFIRVNHNVFLTLVLAALYGTSESLWSETAYSAYLKKLGHGHNEPLGNIEAVSGLATLATALPVGYLADRLGRSQVILAGGILLLLATVAQIEVMAWLGTDPDPDKTDNAFWIFGVIMALWGVGEGVVNGPCDALFADSTLEGERSTYYNYLFACESIASAVGPLVSIIMFQYLGDEWSLHQLSLVIYVGLAIEFVNSFLMMMFDDKKSLDEDSDEESTDEGGEDGMESALDSMSVNIPLQSRRGWIPYIIFAQDVVSDIGSGMTIRFFPLFFKDEVGLTPSQVQAIYIVAPLAMVVFSTVGSKMAGSGFGRVQTQLLFSTLGVSLLYCMVFFKSYLDHHPLVLIPIYILRTCLMNGTYPLQESILMDFVPKSVRARWKSLDSISSFGWCGSAALGGWLADRYDYTYTFLITAILQSIGIVIWAFLLPLVPRTEGPSRASSNQSVSTSEELEVPLLEAD